MQYFYISVSMKIYLKYQKAYRMAHVKLYIYD